jgi:hypothetical protein
VGEWQTREVAAAPKTRSDEYRERLSLYLDKKPYRFE